MTSHSDLPPGFHELRLCVCEREGDARFHERQGHLQLRAPERAAGTDRLGAQAPPAGGTFRQQPELHQGLEGSHSARPKVRLLHVSTTCPGLSLQQRESSSERQNLCINTLTIRK